MNKTGIWCLHYISFSTWEVLIPFISSLSVYNETYLVFFDNIKLIDITITLHEGGFPFETN